MFRVQYIWSLCCLRTGGRGHMHFIAAWIFDTFAKCVWALPLMKFTHTSLWMQWCTQSLFDFHLEVPHVLRYNVQCKHSLLMTQTNEKEDSTPDRCLLRGSQESSHFSLLFRRLSAGPGCVWLPGSTARRAQLGTRGCSQSLQKDGRRYVSN